MLDHQKQTSAILLQTGIPILNKEFLYFNCRSMQSTLGVENWWTDEPTQEIEIQQPF
jgi:hypothetical protein